MIDAPQTFEDASKYRYNQWLGNPSGISYKEDRCAYEVPESTLWLVHQCRRRSGHGPADLYCRQHAKMVTK